MTIDLRAPDERDLSFLFQADVHVGQEELRRVVDAGRVIVAVDETDVQGWLRWGLFWDEIPFMNMVFVQQHRRGEGLGTRLIQHWETQQRVSGHDTVMTSTLADEHAQHRYRRLGYVDCGCLLLPGEPLEILFTKSLAG